MKEIIEILDNNKINYELVEHDPVFTIDEMIDKHITDKGCVCKNLFLRNANGKEHYLVSCEHETVVRMDELATKINSTRLSFASAERLTKYLGLEQGHVSPFGYINDESKSVVFVFNKSLLKKGKVGFHPNVNTATVFVELKDVISLIEAHGNKVLLLDF